VRNKWLSWEPNEGFVGSEGPTVAESPKAGTQDVHISHFPEDEVLENADAPQPTKPTKPFLEAPPETDLPKHDPELSSRAGASRNPPRLPKGVRLISYEPKTAPVAIDVCSVVIDVERFIGQELIALDARLHNPIQIRGGHGVFMILERLRQVGLELSIEPADAHRNEVR
jgi:hypothetical protein